MGSRCKYRCIHPER